MPSADLKKDIKANIGELAALASAGKGEGQTPVLQTQGEVAIVNHLQHSLWPFLDGLCDELAKHEEAHEEAGDVIAELEDAVDELTEGRGTVLMPNEAGVFAVVVQMSRTLIANFEKGTPPTTDQLNGLKLACDAAEKVIQETTINVDTDGDDEEDEDDDDDADD